jgi:predicted secreted acid phosphatase
MFSISDKEFYEYNKKNILYMPIYQYIISNKYLNDIYKVYKNSIKHIQNNYTKNKKYYAIIDLDETFLFNDFYLLHTLNIYKYNLNIYNYYKKKLNPLFGPILPFICILYYYLKHKNINIIFLTARELKYKEDTIKNLKLFKIEYEKIIFKDTDIESFKYKKTQIEQLNKEYDIILILNDQPEFKHKHLIQMPRLYNSIN